MTTKHLSFKAILSFMACMLCPANLVAQNSENFFTCPKLQEGADLFEASTEKRASKRWAENVLAFHPLVDDRIEYTYIIEAKDTFNIEAMMNNTLSWFGVITSSEEESVKNVDKTNHIIEASTAFNDIGKVTGYGNIIVNTKINYQIAFKKNRIKFKTWARHYYIYTHSFSGPVSIVDSYPINPKGKHKINLSKAFVTINSDCITSTQNYIDYMEKHHNEDLKRIETDW